MKDGALALAGGYLADLALGDPRRGHPVAGFGQLAVRVEARTWAPSRRRGTLVVAGLVGSAWVLGSRLGRSRPGAIGLVWCALGGRSLHREARRVADSLADGRLDAARFELRSLCGRDATTLGAEGIAAGVVESLAENTSDAVVASLLWGALAGPGGVAAHRAANTLDAMFGHRSERHAAFGWAAARLDDLLGWPAARLTAGLACVLAPLVGGRPAAAWAAVRRDGPRHPSPNAGPVEAAWAGALGLRLGGPLSYEGRVETRPELGAGRGAVPGDIARASRLAAWVSAAALGVCVGVAEVVR